MVNPVRNTTLYDTTLRDGTQREGLSLSVDDKLRIVSRLDQLGIDYIEGGFPASNPKDVEFFDRVRELPLANAKVVAFGSTRRRGVSAAEDLGLQALVGCGAPAACIVAKSSDLHVIETLHVSPEENLEMVADSVAFLKESGLITFIDAEHFFDGYKRNPGYALSVLRTAVAAGADGVVLCDTNGGTLPTEVAEIVRPAVGAAGEAAAERMAAGGPAPGTESGDIEVGVHFHNDIGCGVANALVGVTAGANHVQGTVNGYGERAGNADLISIIASLVLKMDDTCLTPEQLQQLTSVSHFVAETGNLSPDPHAPYVGASAFAHKGGIHASALERMPDAYEHVDPALVGNAARVVVSELAGRASLRMKAEEMGFAVPEDDAGGILNAIKDMEYEGYSFEAADASLALLMDRKLGSYQPIFRLESFRVIADKLADGRVATEATIKVHVGDERFVATAEGNGPVNALDAALRIAIGRFYPELEHISLADFKVRVLDEHKGTDAVTRVLIESTDGHSQWGTVGVSENVIEASWEALADSIDYGLTHALRRRQGSGAE